ncbi:MAG: hypothetical protein E7618_06440 [Ruminococcaceae bacterium]|nr:hypothetical protein [Oscillospiraceae bacterium]
MKQTPLLFSLAVIGLSLLVLFVSLSALPHFTSPHLLSLPDSRTQTATMSDTEPPPSPSAFSLTLSFPMFPGLQEGTVLISRSTNDMSPSELRYQYEPSVIYELYALLQSLVLIEIPEEEHANAPLTEQYTIAFPTDNGHQIVVLSEDGRLRLPEPLLFEDGRLHLPESSRYARIVNVNQSQEFLQAIREAYQTGCAGFSLLGGLTDDAPTLPPFHIGKLWEMDDKTVAELFTVSEYCAYWEKHTLSPVSLPAPLVSYLYENLCVYLYHHVDGIYLPMIAQEGRPSFPGTYFRMRQDGALNYDEGFLTHLFLLVLSAFSSPEAIVSFLPGDDVTEGSELMPVFGDVTSEAFFYLPDLDEAFDHTVFLRAANGTMKENEGNFSFFFYHDHELHYYETLTSDLAAELFS